MLAISIFKIILLCILATSLLMIYYKLGEDYVHPILFGSSVLLATTELIEYYKILE
jgi:hypothetical protein